MSWSNWMPGLHSTRRLECALREAAPQWRFYPVLLALQTLRGVQFTAAPAEQRPRPMAQAGSFFKT